MPNRRYVRNVLGQFSHTPGSKASGGSKPPGKSGSSRTAAPIKSKKGVLRIHGIDPKSVKAPARTKSTAIKRTPRKAKVSTPDPIKTAPPAISKTKANLDTARANRAAAHKEATGSSSVRDRQLTRKRAGAERRFREAKNNANAGQKAGRQRDARLQSAETGERVKSRYDRISAVTQSVNNERQQRIADRLLRAQNRGAAKSKNTNRNPSMKDATLIPGKKLSATEASTRKAKLDADEAATRKRLGLPPAKRLRTEPQKVTATKEPGPRKADPLQGVSVGSKVTRAGKTGTIKAHGGSYVSADFGNGIEHITRGEFRSGKAKRL